MPEKGWKGKGEKEPRRSPRKRGKTCGRPFKAPRPVSEAVERDSDVVLLTTDVDLHTDSQVQVITETENERDLRGRRRSVMLREREANEMAKYGEVINPSSSDNEKQVRQDTPQQTTIESDTTGSTPGFFLIPMSRISWTVTTDTTDTVSDYAIQARSQSKKTYQGITHVAETELQDDSSEDDIPVSTLLRQEKSVTLTEQQIKDCQDGPQGNRAIGVGVAKMFGGVQYKGTVDSFRTARQRHYYHVVYTDDDEEELSQTELRDGFC
jgi:hypothetical protein